MARPEETTGLGNTSAHDPRTDESLQSLIGFRLKPRVGETIDAARIKKLIRDVHRVTLDGKTWTDLDPKIACANVCDGIGGGARNIFKSIRDDCRYKYVVQTFIAKFGSQSANVSTRCVWDARTDRIVHENYVNEFLVCSTQVIFVYFY